MIDLALLDSEIFTKEELQKEIDALNDKFFKYINCPLLLKSYSHEEVYIEIQHSMDYEVYIDLLECVLNLLKRKGYSICIKDDLRTIKGARHE